MLGKRIINTGAVSCTTDTTQILDAGTTQSTALYRFEDNANDTASSTGKFNKGGVFNGTNSKIDLPTGDLGIGTNDFSISLWFNSADITQDNQSLFWFQHYQSPIRMGAALSQTAYGGDGDVRFYCMIGGASYNVNTNSDIFSSGIWYHAVFVKSSTSGMTIYINGSSAATNTSATGDVNTNMSSGGGNTIGYYKTTASSLYFNGRIDQFRTFNKALSTSEIATLYNETTTTANTLQVLGDTSCISTYTFEGNANDLNTSTPKNGTASNVIYDYSGTASNITYATGKFDKGAVFNGSNSVIDIENMETVMGNNFAVSLWVKTPSTFASSGYPAILSMYGYTGSGSAYGWDIEYNNSNKITFYWVSSYGVGNYILSSSLSTDTWYHVVAQKDSSSANLYINGQLDNDSTYGSAYGMYYNNFNRMTIGAKRLNYGSTSGHISGMVDQVRLFTKQLNSGEINSLYNETVTTAAIATINNPSAVAYYKMADATDETGSYNGTASNVDFNVQGKYGFAGKFNGSSSIITLAAGSFRLATFSIAAWVKQTAQDSSDIILENYDYTSSTSRGFIFRIANAKLKFDGYYSDAAVTTATSNESVPLNVWTHVACVFNPSASGVDRIKLFINGSEATYSARAFNDIQYHTTCPTSIGALSYTGASNEQYYTGYIDQVRIFNKAISASEVTKLYNEVQCANTITTPESYFNTKLYTGTGSVQSITGVGFQPGFVWTKTTTAANNHYLFDSVRGVEKEIYSDLNNAEYSQSGSLTSFDSDGFTIGSAGGVSSAFPRVSWNWKAGSSNTTNNDGTLTSTVSASPESGFSIVRYTGTASYSDTVGHGLTKAPQLIIQKGLSHTVDWYVLINIDGTGAWDWAKLNTTDAFQADSPQRFATSSTTINNWGWTGYDMINYCFHDVPGYQRIGSYVGTGTPENFIYTGFEAAWVLIKNIDSSSKNWVIVDNKRDNGDEWLYANSSSAYYDDSNTYTKFYANGFSVADNGSFVNTLGDSYLFWAIAANPDTTEPTKANSFQTKLYTGTGNSGLQITGLSFKPDFTWIKVRNSSSWNHLLIDSVRGFASDGDAKIVSSNSTEVEFERASISSFNSNGFTLGNYGGSNESSSYNYVSWNWKAADHDRNLASINNDGSISSVVSANPAAGFSVVKYTGNGSNSTVGHGLSSAPDLIITKGMDSVVGNTNWLVYSSATGNTGGLTLNSTSAFATSSTRYNNTSPTSTVFSLGTTGDLNGNGAAYIAYCFKSITGYSKIDSYSGSGSSKSITTGFQPSFLIIKRTDSADSWQIYDDQRGVTKQLEANANNAEYIQDGTSLVSFDSNGFTLGADNSGRVNTNGGNYIYLAIK